MTNDAWFGDTTEPWEHLALAKLRAIEHRRFLVRSTNSGVSAIIDPVGRVVDARARRSRPRRSTPSSAGCAAARSTRSIGDVPWYLVTRRRRRRRVRATDSADSRGSTSKCTRQKARLIPVEQARRSLRQTLHSELPMVASFWLVKACRSAGSWSHAPRSRALSPSSRWLHHHHRATGPLDHDGGLRRPTRRGAAPHRDATSASSSLRAVVDRLPERH